MKYYRNKSSCQGMTLFEILLALSILVLVMSVSYSAIRHITQSKTLLDDSREARKIANAVLSRITRELQLAYSAAPLLPPPGSPNSNVQQNLVMLAETTGTDDSGPRGADSLRFLALEGGQYLPDGGRHSGVVQITYRTEAVRDTGPGPALYRLIRDETPYIRPFKKAYEDRTMSFVITDRITSLRFRFFDPESKSWVDSWGTGNFLKLPAMVEFTLEILSPRGKSHFYSTAVALKSRN